MSDARLTRRQALSTVAGTLAATVGAGAALVPAESPQASPPRSASLSAAPQVRLTPQADLVNTLEFEEQARRVLAPGVHARVADGPRESFDRITLHPRALVPTLDLDLTLMLFGEAMFAPIIVAPVATQRMFHPDGELATQRGARAARAVMVLSSHSSVPVAEVAKEAGGAIWFQVFAGDPAARDQTQQAIAAGCRAVCITTDVAPGSGRDAARLRTVSARRSWAGVEAIKAVAGSLPVVVKGITTAEAALIAGQHDVQGIVVSGYGLGAGSSRDALVLALPPIVDAVDGRFPVLLDGGFRRGTDIIKALALGARAVLVGRPVMWGLAAYGQEGVRAVLEMLQTELARYMAMTGRPNLASLDSSLVRVHARHERPVSSRG